MQGRGLLILAVFLLGGCQTSGNDEMVRYLQRKDTVTVSSGEAVRVNANSQTLNAWPRGVGDRYIETQAARTDRAIADYSGRTKSSGGTQAGTCNSPDDRAADGSRCGGRAADQKPGGR
jgi:hypothetical protein